MQSYMVQKPHAGSDCKNDFYEKVVYIEYIEQEFNYRVISLVQQRKVLQHTFSFTFLMTGSEIY